LRTLPSTKQKIELAKQHQRAEDLRKQADEQLKNDNIYLAILYYSEAIRLNPNDAMAFNGRANAYLKDKNYYQAISDWDHALVLNSSLTEARRNIDNVRQQQQREQEAEAARQREQAVASQRQREREQNDPNFQFNQGVSNYNVKNYYEAIKYFTEAIRLNPNFANAYAFRGSAYYELKNYYEAIANYTQAIRINPNYAAAYNNRGSAYAALGVDRIEKTGQKDRIVMDYYYKAEADYKKASQLDPGNALYIRNLDSIKNNINNR